MPEEKSNIWTLDELDKMTKGLLLQLIRGVGNIDGIEKALNVLAKLRATVIKTQEEPEGPRVIGDFRD